MTIIEVVDFPQPDLADEADTFTAIDAEADAVDRTEIFQFAIGGSRPKSVARVLVAPCRGYSLMSFSTTRRGDPTTAASQ